MRKIKIKINKKSKKNKLVKRNESAGWFPGRELKRSYTIVSSVGVGDGGGVAVVNRVARAPHYPPLGVKGPPNNHCRRRRL